SDSSQSGKPAAAVGMATASMAAALRSLHCNRGGCSDRLPLISSSCCVRIILAMSVGKIGLVHPPAAAAPSGGDLYDRQLLQYAAGCGYPLHSVPWQGDR